MDIKFLSDQIKKEDWKGLLGGKTIISESTLPAAENDSYGISYFWGEFTDDGFKWGTSYSQTTPPAYNRGTVALTGNFSKNDTAHFTSKSDSDTSQTATIKFEFESDTTTIKNVTVTFTDGVYPALKDKPIQCGKPKEKN